MRRNSEITKIKLIKNRDIATMENNGKLIKREREVVVHAMRKIMEI